VDMVVTDLAVFTLARKGAAELRLIELAHGVSLDELRAKTAAPFTEALG